MVLTQGTSQGTPLGMQWADRRGFLVHIHLESAFRSPVAAALTLMRK